MANNTGKKFGGRQSGGTNKVTTEVREVYKKLVEDNAENFQAWIDAIAAIDPAKAMSLLITVSEYFIPKLQRTDMRHEMGEKIESIKIEINKKSNDSNISS